MSGAFRHSFEYGLRMNVPIHPSSRGDHDPIPIAKAVSSIHDARHRGFFGGRSGCRCLDGVDLVRTAQPEEDAHENSRRTGTAEGNKRGTGSKVRIQHFEHICPRSLLPWHAGIPGGEKRTASVMPYVPSRQVPVVR